MSKLNEILFLSLELENLYNILLKIPIIIVKNINF